MSCIFFIYICGSQMFFTAIHFLGEHWKTHLIRKFYKIVSFLPFLPMKYFSNIFVRALHRIKPRHLHFNPSFGFHEQTLCTHPGMTHLSIVLEVRQPAEPMFERVERAEADADSNRPFDPIHAETFVHATQSFLLQDAPYCVHNAGIVLDVPSQTCGTFYNYMLNQAILKFPSS